MVTFDLKMERMREKKKARSASPTTARIRLFPTLKNKIKLAIFVFSDFGHKE